VLMSTSSISGIVSVEAIYQQKWPVSSGTGPNAEHATERCVDQASDVYCLSPSPLAPSRTKS
jgi:hypothetical protein